MIINHATSSNLYRSFYPHRSRQLVSPVCGIFLYDIHIFKLKDVLRKTKAALLVLACGINGPKKCEPGFFFCHLLPLLPHMTMSDTKTSWYELTVFVMIMCSCFESSNKIAKSQCDQYVQIDCRRESSRPVLIAIDKNSAAQSGTVLGT